MNHSFVATQEADDVVLTAFSKGMGVRLQQSARALVFPAGSDWGYYVGARSFRFVPITYGNYLLSFTLLLDDQQGDWNGQLHAWGFVGSLESFLTESSLGNNAPREIFVNHSSLFQHDSLFESMLKGLEPTVPSPRRLHFPWLVRFLLSRRRVGFSWRFDDATQWSNVENWLDQAFRWGLNVKKRVWRGNHPRTFSTFTLSSNEPIGIIGLPDVNNITPVFGIVSHH